jgi:peptidoglycan-associated lipoprotein
MVCANVGNWREPPFATADPVDVWDLRGELRMTRFGQKAVQAMALSLGLLVLGACSSNDAAKVATAPGADGSADLRGSQARPGSQQDLSVNVGDTVLFDVDSHSLRTESQQILQKQAAWLKSNPSVRLVIEGHADERGTRDYNLALGDRRAGAVREYLVSLGVDGSRLESKSYGKERPVCAEAIDSCWTENRRGFSLVMGGAGS